MKSLKALIQKRNISSAYPGVLFKIDHPTLDDLFTPGNVVITHEPQYPAYIVVEYDKIPWLKEQLEHQYIKEKYVLLQLNNTDGDDWFWQDMGSYDVHLCCHKNEVFDVKYILRTPISEKDLITFEKFQSTFQKYRLDHAKYIIAKYC